MPVGSLTRNIYVSSANIQQMIIDQQEYEFIGTLIDPERISDLFNGKLDGAQIEYTENMCILLKQKLNLLMCDFMSVLGTPVDFQQLLDIQNLSRQYYLNTVIKKLGHKYHPLFAQEIEKGEWIGIAQDIPKELFQEFIPWETLRFLIHTVCVTYRIESPQEKQSFLYLEKEMFNAIVKDRRLKG